MKISQICAVVLLLVVGSVVAFADSNNDPKVIVKGVSGNVIGSVDGCEFTCASFFFNFKTPASGFGTLDFTNNTDVTWTSLTLVEHGNNPNIYQISCSASAFFANCLKAVTGQGPGGHPELIFTGGTGIAPGQSFALDFSCNPHCWPTGGVGFGGYANTPNGVTVPEPGTVALMVTGLGALVSRRKQWKNHFQG
jgi:hypothetical protein